MKWLIANEYKNKSGIYIISSTVCDKVYIGRTVCFWERYNHHIRNFKMEECNIKFWKYLQSNSIDTLKFSLLELCNKDLLKSKEEYYIAKFKSTEKGFNVLSKDEDFINLLQKNPRLKDKNFIKQRAENRIKLKTATTLKMSNIKKDLEKEIKKLKSKLVKLELKLSNLK